MRHEIDVVCEKFTFSKLTINAFLQKKKHSIIHKINVDECKQRLFLDSSISFNKVAVFILRNDAGCSQTSERL